MGGTRCLCSSKSVPRDQARKALEAALWCLPRNCGGGIWMNPDMPSITDPSANFVATITRECRTSAAADQIAVLKCMASCEGEKFYGNMLVAHAAAWFLESVANRKQAAGPNIPSVSVGVADVDRVVLLCKYVPCSTSGSCCDAKSCKHIEEIFRLIPRSATSVNLKPGESLFFLNSRGKHSTPARALDFHALRAAHMWSIADICVGSMVGPDSQQMRYKGFTQCGNVVLEDNDGNVRVEPWVRQPVTLVEPADGTDIKLELWLHEELHQKLLLKLRAAVQDLTIRGQSLHELMSDLHCAGVAPVHIAIVGGAVRDVLNDTCAADIDLAVSRTWDQLQRDIRDFFANRGAPLTDASFECTGKRGRFGMMKIVKSAGDKDSVDIGPFKSGRIDAYPGLRERVAAERSRKCEEQYVFGLSYDRDAQVRDYSVNAIYVDIFNWKVFDPRHGLDCYQFCLHEINGAVFPMGPHRLEFVSKDCVEFQKDLGGRVRLFKLLSKMGPSLPSFFVQSDQAQAICAELSREGTGHLRAERVPRDAEGWLRIVVKKLVKPTDDVELRLQCIALTVLHRVPVEARDEAIAFFNSVRDLAQQVRTHTLFRSLTTDDPKDAFLATVLMAWADTSKLTPAGVGDAVQTLERKYTSASMVVNVMRPVQERLRDASAYEFSSRSYSEVLDALAFHLEQSQFALARLNSVTQSVESLRKPLQNARKAVASAVDKAAYRPAAGSDDDSDDLDESTDDYNGLSQKCFEDRCFDLVSEALKEVLPALEQIKGLIQAAVTLAEETLEPYRQALVDVGLLLPVATGHSSIQ